MNFKKSVQIPQGPMMALTHTLHVLAEHGDPSSPQPCRLDFLRNEPKALVIPWYGDLEVDGDLFDPARGDGHPLLVTPSNPEHVRLPHQTYGTNFLMGVPAWLVQAPQPSDLHEGLRTTVIAVGMYYPLNFHLRMDFYLHGELQCRRWCYGPNATRQEMFSNFRQQELAKEWDADLGVALARTPTFNHLMLHQ